LQLAEAEQKYTAHIIRQENAIEVISAQLEMRQSQLDKITSSLGWRLLSSYGRLKYKYLLPVYRLLRLRQPQVKKASNPEVRDNSSATVTAVAETERSLMAPDSLPVVLDQAERADHSDRKQTLSTEQEELLESGDLEI